MMNSHASQHAGPNVQTTNLCIGPLVLEAPVLMAPMAGYTDRAFRRLVRQMGAAFACTGALLDESICVPKVLRGREFRIDDEPRPVGAQIIGHNPATMAQAACALAEHGFDLIDLNFACPVRKVLARRRGGWLLTSPRQALEIFACVRDAVRVPVTAKVRIGLDSTASSNENFMTLVEGLVRGGIDALTVHARTVEQHYRGRADRGIVSELKRLFPSLTLIASGDVRDEAAFVECLVQGADAVAVARGAVGNPWIFARIRALLDGHALPPTPPLTEQRAVLECHLAMASELYGADHALRRLRKFWVQYAHRHPRWRDLHQAFTQVRTRERWLAILDEFYGPAQR